MKPWIASLLAIGLVAGCKSQQQLADTAVDLRREELAVSVLVVNLRDVYNEPVAPTPIGIPWRERFSRAAQWIALNRPDVLMIQEMPGYWCGDRIRDYEAAHYLIDQIRQRSQMEYRIAYLLSHKVGGGYGDWFVGTERLGLCETRGGRALLYRPDRLRNVQRDVGLDFATSNTVGSWPINSLPCCNPRTGTESVCSLIDGPMTRASTCAHDTPAGTAWTRRQDIPDWTFDAVFSRLELKSQPGNFIHLYNIHMSYPNNDGARAQAAINGLVTDMEGRFAQQGIPLYPPILAGDYNLGRPAIDERMPPFDPAGAFARFSVLHWSPELMGVLIGNEAAFSFKQKAIVRDARNLPDFGCMPNPEAGKPDIPSDSRTLWSDHCASIYFRLLPVLDRPS